jgi:hypothetical protein
LERYPVSEREHDDVPHAAPPFQSIRRRSHDLTQGKNQSQARESPGGAIQSGAGDQALRLAAVALRTSQSARGAYYCQLSARMDQPKAITAAAHKLARLVYTMLTRGEEYTDQGQDCYEQRNREGVVHQLSQRAAKLGMKMVTLEQPS